MRKKIVMIFTSRAGYPNGYGATSIIRKYSEGFIKNGMTPFIYLQKPSELKGSPNNHYVSGVYEGVRYRYLCMRNQEVKSKLFKAFLYSLSIMLSCIVILVNRRKIHQIIYYSPDELIFVRPVVLMSKLLKIKIIGIKTESSYSDSERLRRGDWIKKENRLYHNFNNVLVISNYLKEQMKNFYNYEKLKVIPIVVDEFNLEDKTTNEIINITYVGAMKYIEELDLLLNSFEKVVTKKNLCLNIAGGSISNNYFKDIISNGNRKNKTVVLHGFLKKKELLKLYEMTNIFILPRLDTEYSNAGFPLKLGEYLMSGRVTIVTNVGEISNYLTNNINAVIVDDITSKGIARKIEYCIENPQICSEIGIGGKTLAKTYFSVKNQTKEMLDL